ncbi:MAG: cyclase family protein [Clostridia bacterium]|nr:cyclase family protein [Clostridia bacterium]
MKVYDISQEVFGCRVFPGDPSPKRKIIGSIRDGGLCNVTEFSMCAHNGTHIDAPFHFIDGGKTVDRLGTLPFVGPAYVAGHAGLLTGEDAARIIGKAKAAGTEPAKRILIKGPAVLSAEGARVFASSGLLLYGTESQTVGPEDAPMEVHLALLGAGVVLLEGVRLSDVPEGKYFLSAAPLNLGGADGSPCRAVLISGVSEKEEDRNGSV